MGQFSENGRDTTTFKVSKDIKSDARAPKIYSKSLAEKKMQPTGGKKLAKLLAYHKRLVLEKGLPPRNMVQHASDTSSPSPPDQKPGQEGGSTFKCDQCDKTFKSKQKIGNHIRNKHTSEA